MTWYIVGAVWFTISVIFGVLLGRFLERVGRSHIRGPGE